MKVALGTIEVDDVTRRALRHHIGLTGLATREEVRDAYLELAREDVVQIISDLLEDRPYWRDRF